jgi:hypothetical protein
MVVGTSERYENFKTNLDVATGRDAWAVDLEWGALRTISPLTQNHITQVTESGYVIGWGSSQAGVLSGWLYDSNTDSQYTLTYPKSSETFPHFISEDGLVVGSWSDASAAHAFAWTIGGGFTDLSDLIDGDISQADLSQLVSGLQVTPAGDIIGYGRDSSGMFVPFILSNAASVPEPLTSAAVLFVTALLLGRRQKRLARPHEAR